MTESSASKSEYVFRGWKIRITGTGGETTFSARIEVWKPEHDPRRHGGIVVPFLKRAASPAEAHAAAREVAENWIDEQTA